MPTKQPDPLASAPPPEAEDKRQTYSPRFAGSIGVITDDQWRAAKDTLPPQSSHKVFGRLPVSVRAIFESFIWLLKNKKPITQLPEDGFPRKATVNRAIEKWMKDGSLVQAMTAAGMNDLLQVAYKRFAILRGEHRNPTASIYKPQSKAGQAADAELSTTLELSMKSNNLEVLPANKPQQYNDTDAKSGLPKLVKPANKDKLACMTKLFGRVMKFRDISPAEKKAIEVAGGGAGGY